MIEFKKVDNSEEMICYRVHEHLPLSELLQEFRYFLLALGYHPESVEEHIEAE